MVCKKMEKGQDQRERLAIAIIWAEKRKVYIGNGKG